MTAPKIATEQFDPSGRIADSWLNWLQEHVETDWRPGQWDHKLWLYTADPDDPTNTARYCAVSGCDSVVSKGRICRTCSKERRRSGRSLDELIEAGRAPRKKAHPHHNAVRFCEAERETRCARRPVNRGLCLYHYLCWRKALRTAPTMRDLDAWLATGDFAIPSGPIPECAVPGCARDTRTDRSELCHLHYDRFNRSGSTLPKSEWAKTQSPYVSDFQFTLIHLSERLRWEVLYAVQKRDQRGARLDPYLVRMTTKVLAQVPSLPQMTKHEVDEIIGRSRDAGVIAHLAEFARTLAIAYREMSGVPPCDLLVWDLVEAGKSTDPSTIGGTRRRVGLDFTEISQPWLRDAAMALGKKLSSANDVRLMHKSCVIASRALAERYDQGSDLAVLSEEDVDTIYEAIRSSTKPAGGRYATHSQRRHYQWFFEVIDYGLRNDLLPDLPTSFRRSRSHAFPNDQPPESDDTGKSIPIEIQRQLDAALPVIASTTSYGSQTPAQRQLMFATIYTLLKDTGRRPLEIASLKCGCVVRDPNGATLIYDNHKAGRLRRRLPITKSTADAIETWVEVRNTLATIHEASQDYLFPGCTPWQKHVRTHTIAAVLRTWVDGIEHLDAGERDQDGKPVVFDRGRVTARAFRHTYAQRHADNGTPVDVLQQLMDHRSVQTTGIYYVITADRKRKAIETIGRHTVDQAGRSRPLTQSTRYQMRSVAVPFGNCIEPNNVKAGGTGCPIRFQCSGCGYYRPDPSYIPALEQHIVSLRADRETALAMEVAQFVIDNLDAQIAAYAKVLQTMRDLLADLSPVERAQVEEAAATLRKARAGAALPLTVITRTQLGENNDSSP